MARPSHDVGDKLHIGYDAFALSTLLVAIVANVPVLLRQNQCCMLHEAPEVKFSWIPNDAIGQGGPRHSVGSKFDRDGADEEL